VRDGGPIAAIGRLREVATLVAELEDGGGEAGRWLLNLVAEYSSGARLGLRLDELAGLIPQPGHDNWWQIEDLQHRDELLRGVADRWFAAELSRRRQAAAIAKALRPYGTTAWRRDRAFL
jgi:hypothetical protein